MNPIENIWGSLKQYLRNNYKLRNLNQLKEEIRQYWVPLMPKVCQQYIGHLNKVCQQYIGHLNKVIPKMIQENGGPSGS